MYLIQLNDRKEPVLMARLQPDGKWKNINLPTSSLSVDESMSAIIPNDVGNYTFNVMTRPLTFGKTSFLPTLAIESTLNTRHFPPKIYLGTGPVMESNEAKKEIVEFKLADVTKRIAYLKQSMPRPFSLNPQLEKQHTDLIKKQTDLRLNLLQFDEPKNLNDISACIQQAETFLRENNYSGPVAVQISCAVSDVYWNQVFRPVKIALEQQPLSISIENISKNIERETLNGYRVERPNQDFKFYHLLLMQVVNQRLVLLAKVKKSTTAGKKLVFHSWKNIQIEGKDTAFKVIENFNAFADSGNFDPNYFFATSELAIGTSFKSIGQTNSIPKIYISKDLFLNISINTESFDMYPEHLLNPSYLINQQNIYARGVLEYLKTQERNIANEDIERQMMSRIDFIETNDVTSKRKLSGKDEGSKISRTAALFHRLSLTTA
jgi:hypothetical protein